MKRLIVVLIAVLLEGLSALNLFCEDTLHRTGYCMRVYVPPGFAVDAPACVGMEGYFCIVYKPPKRRPPKRRPPQRRPPVVLPEEADPPSMEATSIEKSSEEEPGGSLWDKYPTDCGDTPMYGNSFIVGGHRIEPDEYSWLASLEYGIGIVGGSCGGSVVNSLYVITAAHCVIGKIPSQMMEVVAVRLGDFSGGQKCDYGTHTCRHYQRFAVSKRITHPQYNVGIVGDYDIALLRLKRPIQFTDQVKPICLPFGGQKIDDPKFGARLYVAGWGITYFNDEMPAKRSVVISRQKDKACYKRDDIICAGGEFRGSCSGDSGGPLMHKFKPRRMALVGIVSFGYDLCGSPVAAEGYTRIHSYADWIDQNMKEK